MLKEELTLEEDGLADP